jgi:hypothetical protein
MKFGSGLALICVGAILAFAVTTNTSVFNLRTAGWVLMLVGVIGLVLPNRTYGWLGRRLQVRRSYPSGRVVPPYVPGSPGGSTVQRGLPGRPTLLDQDDDLIEEVETETEVVPEPETVVYRPQATPPGSASQKSSGVTEVIEDYYEEP